MLSLISGDTARELESTPHSFVYDVTDIQGRLILVTAIVHLLMASTTDAITKVKGYLCSPMDNGTGAGYHFVCCVFKSDSWKEL